MDNEKRYYLGIDIGGTKTNIGIVGEKGDIYTIKKVATISSGDKVDQFIDKVIKEAKDMMKQLNPDCFIKSIGIGVPGTVDHRTGKVIYAPNIGWRNIDVRKIFESHFGVPVFVGQDTEAAVLGEYLYGEGRGRQSLVCITIGTGIGSGIIIDGKIYKGQYGTAGEIGHTIVVENGIKCICGRRGCLEAYSSGPAILSHYKEALIREQESIIGGSFSNELKTEDVFLKAKEGDALSFKIIEKAVNHLSIGIANMINILCPEVVILSGGISTEESLFIKPLVKRTKEQFYHLLEEKVNICTAQLGENAPLVGSAMFFKDPLFGMGE